MSAGRFVFGLEGPTLGDREEKLFRRHPPFGFVLFSRNLESAVSIVALVEQLRSISDPPPLLFVDQEGGTVDRIGPVLGIRFPSASTCAEKGADRVHECAFLMGRAARLLGLDVDFAPVLDLAQPGTGAVVLSGRTFGFHAEDAVLAGSVFLHGLARAGVLSCLKHFPGLGRGAVDTHKARPVVDAHDVDLMVTDVLPFTRLARQADGVMVGHAAYPGLTGDEEPASLSKAICRLLRGPVGFPGVVYSDDLTMGALGGTVAERAARAADAGCDVLVVASGFDSYEEAIDALAEDEKAQDEAAAEARRNTLRQRAAVNPRPAFSESAWRELGDEVKRFVDSLSKPRPRRADSDFEIDAG